MRAVKLLYNLFDIACHTIDKRLRKTLFSAAEALTRCQQLSICALGRSLNRSAQVKHTIKCMDRLFGNKKLHKSGHVFYRKITQLLLKNNQRPVILVDWSRLTPCGTFHFLSAHIAIQGRSLPLYSQAYPLKQYSAPKTHREFLQRLKTFLPETCRPIIVTDAGFRNSWFKLVVEMGWHFVGRVRNRTHYCPINQTAWLPIKSLYNHATTSARYLGHVLLCCRFPLSCHFYIIKKPKKYRIKKNLAGKKVQSKASKQHEKGAKLSQLYSRTVKCGFVNCRTCHVDFMDIRNSGEEQ